ncbi:MAG TPA: choice-of-anchor Q domain-containing protein, partial [Anaerolineae bacterium]
MSQQPDRSIVVRPVHVTSASSLKPQKNFPSSILALMLAFLFVALAWLSLNPIRAYAATLTVVNTNDSGPGSLREALVNAAAGDTITFASSLANQTIVLTTTEIVVTQTNITIDGSNAPGVMVDGNNAMRVFSVTAPISIISLTIQNGNVTGDGGGLYTTSALTLTNVNFLTNTASIQGGGLYAGATVWLTGTQFVSNTASSDGGGAFVFYTATLNGGLFQSNTSNSEGGGLWLFDTVELTGTQFISNTADGCGGGAFAGGAATLNSGLFQSNTSTCSGGGLYANSTLALTDMQFISNTASAWGGAVYALNNLTALNTDFFYNSTLSNGGGAVAGDANSASIILAFTNGVFKQNTAGNRGGGLFTRSTLFITGTTFLTNTAAGNGGGVYASRNVTLTDAVFQGNVGGTSGGGASVQGTLTLSTTNFMDNQANGTGGGAYAEKGATVIGGVFQSNRTLNARGGGLRVIGSLALTNTRFISNTSGTEGGGLFAGGSTSRLVNALFARNRATTNIGAAAAFTGTATLLHNTIVDNGLNPGSAIFGLTSTVRLTNTLIASHTIALENWGGTFEQDYNLFFGNTVTSSGTIGGGANNVSGDPNFVDPANDDYHLGADSAAIDMGTDMGVITDFDGDTRPQGFSTDIGYDEVLQDCGGLATNTDYPLLSSPTVTVSFSALGDVYCLAAVYFPRGHYHATGTFGSGVGADHFWQIAARNSSGITATGFTVSVTVPYSGLPTPVLCFYLGALGGYDWDCTGTQSNDGSTITRTGLTHFSDWAVGNAGPTAITLESFTVRNESRSAPIGLLLLIGAIGSVIGFAAWRMRR